MLILDIVGIGIYGGEDMQFCVCDPYGNTSNYAQLFAIQVALSFAWNRGDRRITIRTGSEFAKKCILHLHNDHWLARYGTGEHKFSFRIVFVIYCKDNGSLRRALLLLTEEFYTTLLK